MDVDVEEETPEKEWTFQKILTRLFLYPFCIGLILPKIFIAISTKQYGLSLLSIGIAMRYFFVD